MNAALRFVVGFAIGVAIVALMAAFTTWGQSPAEWEPANRFIVSFWALIAGFLGAIGFVGYGE